MTRRRRRRRNQSNPAPVVPIAIGIVTAIAGVGLGLWIAGRREAQEAADELFKGWRLPDADFRVHLADTPDDFQRIDDEVCECAENVLAEAADDADLAILIDEVRLCVAHRLHPDLEWPPVPGDHPTVGQMWTELGVIARRAIVTETACDPMVPHPPNIPEPKPFPQDLEAP
jgi:hypothetical protein